jgi:uncharacterized protein YndB with AHSA1/START domain
MSDIATTSELKLSRHLDAPREHVYEAFTDPDLIAAWFGPVGFTVPRDTVDIDPRPGGRQRFVMVSDDDPGIQSPVDATYTEIVENELIVGEEDAPEMPGLQEATTITARIELHDDAGGTRLELHQFPLSAQMAEMGRLGWESSFTKLDRLLAG